MKFVHHVATHYDIGVYFEANGHGTVLMSPKIVAKIRARLVELQQQPKVKNGSSQDGSNGGNGSGDNASKDEARAELACRRLLAFTQLVNQAVRLQKEKETGE